MDIRDLEPTPPTIDPTPRPRAAQFTRRPPVETITGVPAFELRPSHVFAVVLSGLFLAGLIILIASSSGRPIQRAQPTPIPTNAASDTRKTLFAPPTSTPVLAPTPPTMPSVAPEPSGDVPEASGEVLPMTGQGMTLAEPAPAVEVEPAEQYIQNVGAQAPHSPRGDGQAGPAGGDYVIVPTLAPAQLEIVGAQAPHKVR